jgi:hypothetical protein
LVHEMAHLWQDHFGKPGRGRYHNQEWADKMEALGLIPSDTGQPGGHKTGDRMDHYVEAGGRFKAAAKSLFETDFRLTWYDRYPPMTAMPPRPTESDPDTEIGPHETMPAAANSAVAMALHSRAPGQGGRWKYTCPSCEVQAWGKPQLNLVCGDCQVALIGID